VHAARTHTHAARTRAAYSQALRASKIFFSKSLGQFPWWKYQIIGHITEFNTKLKFHILNMLSSTTKTVPDFCDPNAIFHEILYFPPFHASLL
jgi:hypothetical protein